MVTLLRFFGIWKLQLLGFTTTLLIVNLYVYQPGWLRILDSKLYDNVLKQAHTKETLGVVTIVDLDESSLQRYGQWPWPRYRIALLLQKLRQSGVRAVGLDILFSEPDRSSPCILQEELKKDLNVDLSFQGLPEALEDNDKIFAQILEQGPYVLGFFFDFEHGSHARDSHKLKDLNPAIVTEGGGNANPDKYLLSAPAVIPPLDAFCEAVPATGYINSLRDKDGVIRTTPLVMEYKNKIFATLGFSVLRTAMGMPPAILKSSGTGIKSIRLGKTVIPLDGHGRLWLHFRGPKGTFPYISAGDVLDNKVEPDELRDKIVLIGTSAAGLRDLRATPLDSDYPGVEAHATLIDNILTGDFITVPEWLPGMELSLTLVAGFVTTILVGWLSAWYIMPVILLFAFGAWYTSFWIFANYHFYFSPLFPVMVAGTNFTILNFVKFVLTEQQKRFLRRAFSTYVSRSVVDRIVEAPDMLSLDGEEKEVSILFSDIRGFTTLSEQLSPTQITSLLHSYLTPMTKVIVNNEGTLDKFIGDAVMAFWNAPLEVDEHRKKSVLAALSMLDALDSLNETFEFTYGLKLTIGIGLHAGNVSVGNMGSEDLFDYTIIGDNVNLTSRLEGLTKFYGVPLIVSDAMQDVAIEGYALQKIDKVRVKGKEKPVSLYTFRKNDMLVDSEIDIWEKVLALYGQREFSSAGSLLVRLIEEQPAILLYQLYKKRCDDFLADLPPDDWQGVYSHTSK